jgi:hypothetical protein
MKFNIKIAKFLAIILAIGFVFSACQKLKRPVLGDYPKDPPPPPYSILKSYFTFDNTDRDTGQYRLPVTSKNITYVTGISGQAAQIGAGGYILSTKLNDSLKTIGSFTLAFWMKAAAGPVQNGAQGVFAVSNSGQFWGNLEIFLENYNDATDPNAAFMKIHMFNANVTGGGEEWLQDDNSKLKNVLGKWTHIALTYDAATSKVTLYKDGSPTGVNGKVLGGGNYGNIRWAGVTGMVLGSYAFQTDPSLTNHGPESWAKSFNGALDNLRFYNVPLSAADVMALYSNKQ